MESFKQNTKRLLGKFSVGFFAYFTFLAKIPAFFLASVCDHSQSNNLSFPKNLTAALTEKLNFAFLQISDKLSVPLEPENTRLDIFENSKKNYLKSEIFL